MRDKFWSPGLLSIVRFLIVSIPKIVCLIMPFSKVTIFGLWYSKQWILCNAACLANAKILIFLVELAWFPMFSRSFWEVWPVYVLLNYLHWILNQHQIDFSMYTLARVWKYTVVPLTWVFNSLVHWLLIKITIDFVHIYCYTNDVPFSSYPFSSLKLKVICI